MDVRGVGDFDLYHISNLHVHDVAHDNYVGNLRYEVPPSNKELFPFDYRVIPAEYFLYRVRTYSFRTLAVWKFLYDAWNYTYTTFRTVNVPFDMDGLLSVVVR